MMAEYNLGKVKGTDGKSVTSGTINSSGHLILTMSDSSTIDCGSAKGADGGTWQVAEDIPTEDDSTVGIKLSTHSSRLDDIAYFAIDSVVPNDASKASANATALNALLAHKSKTVRLPVGNIYINNTLIVDSTILQGSGCGVTKLIPTDTSKSVIEIKNNASLLDFDITLPNNYTSNVILLTSDSMVDAAEVRNVNIYGYANTYSGTAIRAEGEDGWVQFVRFVNMTIRFVETALSTSFTGTGYFNGNTFTNINFNNVSRIAELHDAEGNIFTGFSAEPSPTTSIFFNLVSSNYNYFSGFIWDIDNTSYIYVFDNNSNGNMLTDTFYENGVGQIQDYGKQNRRILNSKENFGIKVDKNVTGYDDAGNYNYLPPYMTGSQDDLLATANYEYTVTSTGISSSGGTVDYVFGNSDPGYYVEYTDPTSPSPVVITIDGKASNAFRNLQVVGICFSNMYIGKDIDIQLSNDGTNWNAGETLVNSSSIAYTTFGSNYYDGISARYIRITISSALYNAVINTDKKVRISRIFASSNRMAGKAWASTRGGNMWGDLTYSVGKGPILISPDGNTKKRIGIDNSGNLTLTTIT